MVKIKKRASDSVLPRTEFLIYRYADRLLSILTQPNMYARGILFGKMKYELGDHSYVRCPENNLVADIEFKTKGYFSGTYNAIGGTIKNEKTGEILYELSGLWNGEMHIKNVKVCSHLRLSCQTTMLIKGAGPPQRPTLRCNTCEALETHSTTD